MIAFEHDQLLQHFSETSDKAFMQLSLDWDSAASVRRKIFTYLDMFDDRIVDSLTHSGAVTVMFDTMEEAYNVYLKVVRQLGVLPSIDLGRVDEFDQA